MQIGGIQKLSLMDFPGTMASVLFTTGCNLRCPYCHNAALLEPTAVPNLAWTDIIDFLRARRGFLDGVVISGGEPTLQPKLAASIAQIKEMGFSVKLDTNGSRPEVLAGLLQQGLLDYVAMDLKTLPEWYPVWLQAPPKSVQDLRRSIEMLLASGVTHEFRTTCAAPLVSEAVVEKLGRLILGADCWTLQQVCLDSVLDPAFFNGTHAVPDAQAVARLEIIAGRFVNNTAVRLVNGGKPLHVPGTRVPNAAVGV